MRIFPLAIAPLKFCMFLALTDQLNLINDQQIDGIPTGDDKVINTHENYKKISKDPHDIERRVIDTEDGADYKNTVHCKLNQKQYNCYYLFDGCSMGVRIYFVVVAG